MGEIEQLRAALADARAVADRICEFSDGQMEDGDAARRECRALIERIDALKLAPHYEWTKLGLGEPILSGRAFVGAPETIWQPGDPDAAPYLGLTFAQSPERAVRLSKEQMDSLVTKGEWAEPLEIDVEFPSGTWPATLTAAEVTEPGWYWYREDGDAWQVVASHGIGFFLAGSPKWFRAPDLPGTFIGPLRAPE